MTEIDVLYRDDNYLAVNKPSGMFVHRSEMDPQAEFILGRVRDLAGCHVWPVHRLDRPTSGVVVFALSQEAAGLLSRQFREKEVEKKYLAVVRGYINEDGHIDYPLRKTNESPLQSAVTNYKCLATCELKYPVGRYDTARFSLVDVRPVSGRYHQIRKHFAHIAHPVLCDTVHGDGRQNRFLRSRFDINRLLLAAVGIRFKNPYTSEYINIDAPLALEMKTVINKMFV